MAPDVATLRAQYEEQLAAGGRRVCIGLLTGGQSTRMGQDKATTAVAGRSMAQRVAEACRATGLETIVLGPTDAETGLESLPDDDAAPAGPLGGLFTLLAARPDHHVILVATDQPFVRTATLLQLALEPAGDIVVPFFVATRRVLVAMRSGANFGAIRSPLASTKEMKSASLGCIIIWWAARS